MLRNLEINTGIASVCLSRSFISALAAKSLIRRSADAFIQISTIDQRSTISKSSASSGKLNAASMSLLTVLDFS